jgi:hypothetical protein
MFHLSLYILILQLFMHEIDLQAMGCLLLVYIVKVGKIS